MSNEETWPNGYWQDLYGCWDNEKELPNEDTCLDTSLDDACDWFVEV